MNDDLKGIIKDMSAVEVYLKGIYTLLREREIREPRGTTGEFELTLQINQSYNTKLFFDGKTPHQHLPPNTTIHFPNRPLSRLILLNIGPADIRYSTNQPEDSELTTSLLEADEDREIRVNLNTIKSLFLRAIPIPADATATTAYLRVETLS